MLSKERVTDIAVGGETASRLNQNTVLVVDDDADLRDALHDVLREEGYAVVLASNGREALRLLPTLKRPCGIVLDIAMPVMNGADFYDAMSGLPAFADIPVVVLTSDLSRAPSGLPKMIKISLERFLAMVAALFSGGGDLRSGISGRGRDGRRGAPAANDVAGHGDGNAPGPYRQDVEQGEVIEDVAAVAGGNDQPDHRFSSRRGNLSVHVFGNVEGRQRCEGRIEEAQAGATRVESSHVFQGLMIVEEPAAVSDDLRHRDRVSGLSGRDLDVCPGATGGDDTGRQQQRQEAVHGAPPAAVPAWSRKMIPRGPE